MAFHLRSFLRVRLPVLHLHKTTGKIIYFLSLIFRFLFMRGLYFILSVLRIFSRVLVTIDGVWIGE
jgi:hypothetical protein